MFANFRKIRYRHKIRNDIRQQDYQKIKNCFLETEPDQYGVLIDAFYDVIEQLIPFDQLDLGECDYIATTETLQALVEIIQSLDDNNIHQLSSSDKETGNKVLLIKCLIPLYMGYSLYRLGAVAKARDQFKSIVLLEPSATETTRLIYEIARNNYAACMYLADRATRQPRSLFDGIIDDSFTNEGDRCAYHNRDHISDVIRTATNIGTVLFTGDEGFCEEKAKSEVFSGTMILESDEEQDEWEAADESGGPEDTLKEKELSPEILALAAEIQHKRNNVPLITRLAALYLRDGEFENAELCLRRLTQLEPEKPVHEARLNNFKTMLLEKEAEELKHIVGDNCNKPIIKRIGGRCRAFPVSPQTIAREKDIPRVYYKLGQKYFMTRRYIEALRCFKTLLATPGFGGISKKRLYYYLGITLLQLSLTQEAFAFFKDIQLTNLNDNPVHKKIVYDLATIYEHFGMTEQAGNYYEFLTSVDREFLDVSGKFEKFQAMTPPEPLTSHPSILQNHVINVRISPLPFLKSNFVAVKNRGSDQPVCIGLLQSSSSGTLETMRVYRKLGQEDSEFPAPLVRYYEMHPGALPALIYEPLEGTPLRKSILEQGFPSLDHFSRVCEQIAEALQYLHGKGITHGALDTGNIVVTTSGNVKLFGAALGTGVLSEKFLFEKHGCGPYLYFSPEKIMHNQPGVAGDIYSFGVIMYEMLTGFPPFISGNIPFSHCYREIPNIQTDSTIPEPYLKTVYRCLEKKPEDRFQSVKEILSCFRQGQ